MATLRRTRNGLTPVNKTPAEILSHIFSFVPGPPHKLGRMGSLMRDFGPYALSPVEDLLPLLAVCSLWRCVATNSPFLWSTIDNRNPRAFAISSKYRPVHGLLDAHIKDAYHPPGAGPGHQFDGLRQFPSLHAKFLNLLQNEGHRIRDFHADVVAVNLSAMLEFSAESLQTCQLRLLENDDGHDDLGAVRPLFRGYTPKLESLIMTRILFIPSNHFPSLTHLILGGERRFNPIGPYTFHNFLLFLSRCPNLEVLHLYALDVARFGEMPGDRMFTPLSLPHLRKFSNEEALLDNTEDYDLPYSGPHFRRAILAHLQLSPDCVIRLSAILPDDIGRTLRCLPLDQPFTSVYLSAHNPSSSRADISRNNWLRTECFSIMATDRNRPRGVRIDFQMPGTRYVAENVTTQSARASISATIRDVSLLACVHELWVVPTANVLLGEPYSLFVAFPHLMTLVLGLYVVPESMRDQDKPHWEPFRALEVRDEDPVVPCPKLHTLCVYVTTETHIVDLYAMLLSRGEAGHPIRRLVVGFYKPPTRYSMWHLAGGLEGLVEDFTLLRQGEPCPDEFLWVHRLPFVCRDSSEHNWYWPAWM